MLSKIPFVIKSVLPLTLLSSPLLLAASQPTDLETYGVYCNESSVSTNSRPVSGSVQPVSNSTPSSTPGSTLGQETSAGDTDAAWRDSLGRLSHRAATAVQLLLSNPYAASPRSDNGLSTGTTQNTQNNCLALNGEQAPGNNTRAKQAEMPFIQGLQPLVELPDFGISPMPESPVESPVVETVVETPSIEPVEGETPVAETPVAETPVAETPVAETPVEETPVAETPIAETPIVETPVEETPVAETPVAKPPAIETPETPNLENLTPETPRSEFPVAESPSGESPTAAPPTAVPSTFELPVFEPATGEPPAAAPPAVSSPAVESPAVIEAPAIESPAVEFPAVEPPSPPPTAETPAIESPAIESPAVETPAAPSTATPAPVSTPPAPPATESSPLDQPSSVDPNNVTPTTVEATPFDGSAIATLASRPDGNYRYLAGNAEFRTYTDAELQQLGGSVFVLKKAGNTITGNLLPAIGQPGICVTGIVSGNMVTGSAYPYGTPAASGESADTSGNVNETTLQQYGNGVLVVSRPTRPAAGGFYYAGAVLDLSGFSLINAGVSVPPSGCSAGQAVQ